jgi:PAS domain S-box-containing protein
VLIETANSIILRWAPSGRIFFINPYGQRFFGYSEKELYGKNVMILASDKESAGRDKPSLSVDIANHPERYVTYVNENVRKDGSVVWVSWTNKAIKNQYGEFVEILAIGNDVTSLKRTEQDLRASEKRLRLATDAAQLGIFDGY